MTDPHVQIDTAVLGSRGELLGHVGAIYVDNATGVPVWALVQCREHTAVVPLAQSRRDGDTRPGTARSGTPREDGVVVRSEEQLRVGAVNVVVGRARLVTFVVTENQTFTVPVSRPGPHGPPGRHDEPGRHRADPIRADRPHPHRRLCGRTTMGMISNGVAFGLGYACARPEGRRQLLVLRSGSSAPVADTAEADVAAGVGLDAALAGRAGNRHRTATTAQPAERRP